MARRATRLTLRSVTAECWTSLSVSCTVPSTLPPSAFHQLLAWLEFWSGRRLDVVLDAAGPAGWCEVWFDALSAVPERRVRIHFDLSHQEDDRAAE